MNTLVIALAFIASAMCTPVPEVFPHQGGFLGGHFGGGGLIGGPGGGFGRGYGGGYDGPIGRHGGFIGGNNLGGFGGYGGAGHYAPANYNFGYGVSDAYHGTNFGHSERRQGHRTEGEYFVDLPDGRRQKVTYYADETGYHPTITYEGVAHYPPARHVGPVGPGRYH